jgi:oligopeptide/dipeptide ABC transporter ATP-binding protein
MRTRVFRSILRSPTGAIGAVSSTAVVVVAIVGHRVWGDRAVAINPIDSLQGPSSSHLLGTDQLGRDIFYRTLAAAGLSLKMALLATALAAVLGVPIGAATGVFGLRYRRLTERAIKLSLTFPGLLVGLALVTMIGPGEKGAVIAIGVAFAPQFARTSQTLAAAVADSDYMAAARVVGVSRSRLFRRYVLANTGDALVLQTAALFGSTLIAVATFSFLGLGLQAPQFDWGRMLGEGLPIISTAPSNALAPGAAILIAAVSISMLGEAIAGALDPAPRARPTLEPRARSSTVQHSDAVTTDVTPVLQVEGLRVMFPGPGHDVVAVAGIDLAVAEGEIVGVVGESGSGKSTVALAVAGLVGPSGEVSAARLEFMGVDLLAVKGRTRSSLLGRKLAAIFQDPMSSLNPAVTIGVQISEKAEAHLGSSRREAKALAVKGLADTRIPGPVARVDQYPHEFSGGMRQRVMIAMGLVTSPSLILADEPTTALDVTVQAEILDLLRDLNRETGAAILFISHDIAVVTSLCSRLVVMYAGRVVEVVDVADLPAGAMHPYTRALLSTVVDLEHDPAERLATVPGQAVVDGSLQAGCAFAPRCPLVVDRCRVQEPPLMRHSGRGSAACWITVNQEEEGH